MDVCNLPVLPITFTKELIYREISCNNFLVITGETGCGKTTKVPSYVFEILSKTLKCLINICCVEPRRIAAITAAEQVAKDSKCKIGITVGYHVRFDNQTSNLTRICFKTDGVVFRELIQDKYLYKYSAVIIDEAHEGSIYNDVLMPLLKEAVAHRNHSTKPLKLIIMSATINVLRYSRFFDDCKIIYVKGRQYNVDIFYSEIPQSSYLRSSITTAILIHKEDTECTCLGFGTILIFLTGEEEIETAAKQLRHVSSMFSKEYPLHPLIKVYVLYSNLPKEQQKMCMFNSNKHDRKIIFATNIAETSVTIPGVKYIIDCGKVKRRRFDYSTGLESLKVVSISREQAIQRAGRAGRDQHGKCYRLYTSNIWDEMKMYSKREITYCDLTSIILEMIAIGVSDIESFAFFESPDIKLLRMYLDKLVSLQCVNKMEKSHGHYNYILNDIGAKMVHFPVNPYSSKLILQSIEYSCSREILLIVSLLSMDDIIFIPIEKQSSFVRISSSFDTKAGDHILYINILKGWINSDYENFGGMDHFLNQRNCEIFRNVYRQFCDIFTSTFSLSITTSSNVDEIQKCLLSVLFCNLCEHQGDGKFLSLAYGMLFYIHPSSCCFKTNPDYLIFSNLVTTTKPYMKFVTPISKELANDYLHLVRKYKPKSVFSLDILL